MFCGEGRIREFLGSRPFDCRVSRCIFAMVLLRSAASQKSRAFARVYQAGRVEAVVNTKNVLIILYAGLGESFFGILQHLKEGTLI